MSMLILCVFVFFFFKQKTAYEMRISDWSSDVCSSDLFGGLITNHAPTQRVLPPFFSNLLPEGPLWSYLADRAGVHHDREFFLLWMLGKDLPGAISIKPVDGEELPPEANESHAHGHNRVLRFSLAGVQPKFSAIRNEGKGVGLTIPAEGAGGSWIVKKIGRV